MDLILDINQKDYQLIQAAEIKFLWAVVEYNSSDQKNYDTQWNELKLYLNNKNKKTH